MPSAAMPSAVAEKPAAPQEARGCDDREGHPGGDGRLDFDAEDDPREGEEDDRGDAEEPDAEYKQQPHARAPWPLWLERAEREAGAGGGRTLPLPGVLAAQ